MQLPEVSVTTRSGQPDPILESVSAVEFKGQDIDKKIYSFSIGIFEIIYKLVKLGNKPLNLVAERFQTLTYQKPSITLLTHIRRFILVLAAIPVLLGSLPINIACGLLKKFRQNFAYSPTTVKTAQVARSFLAEQNKLKTMTWNTGLGPGFMAIDNRLKKPQDRVNAVVELIQEQDPHVVCLQEVFDEGATATLVEELNKKGYDVVHSALCTSHLALSSGLLVAVKRESNVKLEIEKVKIWEFKNLAGADAFSRKAVMGVKIKMTHVEREEYLHVFNTHLQSSYNSEGGGYGEVRRDQITAIARIVKEWADKTLSGVMVCGDMNFGRKALEPTDDRDIQFTDTSKQPANEYEVQLDTLSQAGLIDPNREAQDQNNGTFYELKKGAQERIKSVVDYIFINQALAKSLVQPEIVGLDLNDLASDHCPVVQTLDLKPFAPHADDLD